MSNENRTGNIKYTAKVTRFFTRLGNSPLRKFMSFDTSIEKAQAIIKFAEMVGVPRSRLPILIQAFRQASSGKRNSKDASSEE